jgi:hypothetical protein
LPRKKWKSQTDINNEIKKVVKRVEHEIKENTELAEHDRGIHDVKNGAKSIYDKTKKLVPD